MNNPDKEVLVVSLTVCRNTAKRSTAPLIGSLARCPFERLKQKLHGTAFTSTGPSVPQSGGQLSLELCLCPQDICVSFTLENLTLRFYWGGLNGMRFPQQFLSFFSFFLKCVQ